MPIFTPDLFYPNLEALWAQWEGWNHRQVSFISQKCFGGVALIVEPKIQLPASPSLVNTRMYDIKPGLQPGQIVLNWNGPQRHHQLSSTLSWISSRQICKRHLIQTEGIDAQPKIQHKNNKMVTLYNYHTKAGQQTISTATNWQSENLLQLNLNLLRFHRSSWSELFNCHSVAFTCPWFCDDVSQDWRQKDTGCRDAVARPQSQHMMAIDKAWLTNGQTTDPHHTAVDKYSMVSV